jgi:Nuclease A inhibitor-like protein
MIALENILPNYYRAWLLFHHYYQITTKVFKVGEFEFDAYILGIIDGDLVGLQTKVVQT